MLRSTTHPMGQTFENRAVLAGFLSVSAVLGGLLLLAGELAFGGATVPLVVFGGALGLTAYALAGGYPHQSFGTCNAVTMTRLAMVAFLTGALIVPTASPWLIFAVASVAFALDGVDGWLARRSGLMSDFGARFDMETDAALGAVIAAWLLISGTTGPEILILGFMRYAFVAASLPIAALRAPLPEAFRRKAICVVQIAALIALIFPLTPAALVVPISGVAALLLSWSFLVDIIWLLRRPA